MIGNAAIHIKNPVIVQTLWIVSPELGKDLVVGLIYLANTMPILISHKIGLKVQTTVKCFTSSAFLC